MRHRRLCALLCFGFISLWKYIAQSSQGTSKDIIIITEAAQHLYGADVPACIIISERKRGWRKILFCENKDVGGSKTSNFCDFTKLHYTLQEKLSSFWTPKQMRKLIQTWGRKRRVCAGI